MFTLPEIKINNSYVSSIFYILFSKHYILSRETSNNHPSGYETDLNPQTKNPYFRSDLVFYFLPIFDLQNHHFYRTILQNF